MEKKRIITRMFLRLVVVASVIMLLSACSDSTTSSSKTNGKNSIADYPEDKISFLVGFDPGGSQDVVVRNAVQTLETEEIVNQTMVVENKPGASGALAMQEIKKDIDNPYKLVAATSFGIPLWTRGVGLEISDFKPVTTLMTSDMYITVAGDSQYQTINELFDDIRQDPKSINIGLSAAMDGEEPFRWDTIGKELGIDELSLISNGGEPANLKSLLGNEVDVIFGPVATVKDYFESGELKPLAILSDERSEEFPDVPTLKEETDIDFAFQRYYSVWIGGDVSDEVVDYWYDTFTEMSETKTWKEFLERESFTPLNLKPDELLDLSENEGPQYRDYVDSLE